ncbi:MAG: FHA domain-containing protein, partial [Lachnospiraceae bacterium]
LTDCGSRYGTFLNGVRLMPNESMTLQCNDQVRLGNLSFVFR